MLIRWVIKPRDNMAVWSFVFEKTESQLFSQSSSFLSHLLSFYFLSSLLLVLIFVSLTDKLTNFNHSSDENSSDENSRDENSSGENSRDENSSWWKSQKFVILDRKLEKSTLEILKRRKNLGSWNFGGKIKEARKINWRERTNHITRMKSILSKEKFIGPIFEAVRNDQIITRTEKRTRSPGFGKGKETKVTSTDGRKWPQWPIQQGSHQISWSFFPSFDNLKLLEAWFETQKCPIRFRERGKEGKLS